MGTLMDFNVNPSGGGLVENVVYDASNDLTWSAGAGTGTVNAAFPVTVFVEAISGNVGNQIATTSESVDLSKFNTLIVDANLTIDVTSVTDEINLGEIIIKVDGTSVFSFIQQMNNMIDSNFRFVVDISSLSLNGVIEIEIEANATSVFTAETEIILNELKLINKAV